MIDYLFIITSKKDYYNFIASRTLILKNLKSLSYSIVIPDNDYDLFSNSSHGFHLVKESAILGELVTKISIKDLSLRKWYLQQILKLELIRQLPDGVNVVIWDGDTIPYKKIKLLNRGYFYYYKSSEFHHQYFRSIFNILGISKSLDFSFISQHFVCKSDWVKLMINCIEKNKKKHYVDCIVEIAKSSSEHTFSEYETLGTFVNKYFFYEIKFIDSDQWLRFGYSIFHNPYNKSIRKSEFDFISFESWEKDFNIFKKLFIKLIFSIRKFRRILYL